MYKGYTPSPLWRLLSKMDDVEGTDQEGLMSQDERTYGPGGQRPRSPPMPGSPTLSPDFHSHLHQSFHNKSTLSTSGPDRHKRSRSPSRSPRPGTARYGRDRSRSPRPSSLRETRERTPEMAAISRSASYRDHRRSSAERRPSHSPNPSPASSFGATSPNPSPRGSLLDHSPDHQLNKWTSRGSIRKSPRGSMRRYSSGRGQTWHKRLHSSDKWQSSFRNANPYMTQGFAQSYRAPAIEILMGTLIFVSGLVLLIIGFCVGDQTWMYISAGCCGVGIMFVILGCCWYSFLDTKELGSSKKKNPGHEEEGEAHPGQLDKPRESDVEEIVDERRQSNLLSANY